MEQAQSPLHRLEHTLHPYVTYAVLPVFAFMNAGVPVSAGGVGAVTLGTVLGLLLGKPLGVIGAAWLAVLPERVNWPLLSGVGFLAGIGFTVSLFVSNLAFEDAALLTQAKLGVLIGTMASAVLGSVWLAVALGRQGKPEAERPYSVGRCG